MLKILRTRGPFSIDSCHKSLGSLEYIQTNLHGKAVPPSSSCSQVVWEGWKSLMVIATYYESGLFINLLALLNHVHVGF